MNTDARAREIYMEELRDAFDGVVKKYDAPPSEVLVALRQLVMDEALFQQDLKKYDFIIREVGRESSSILESS